MSSSSLSSSLGNNPNGRADEPVHETNEHIPRLASAPPSGNSVLSSGSTSTNSSLPFALPPRPVPPFRTTSTSASTSAAIGPSSALPPPPTVASSSSASKMSLPPPPRVTTARSGAKVRTPPRQPSLASGMSASILASPGSPAVASASLQPPPPPLPPPPPPPPPPPRSKEPSPESIEGGGGGGGEEETDQSQQCSEQDSAPTPPPFLPVTTFAGKKKTTPVRARDQKLRSVLARRQTHVPILIIATEAANELAWKNGLQLSDLLQGVAEDVSPSLKTMTPFRSVSRSLFLKDVGVQFVTSSQLDGPYTFEDTQAMMSECVSLREGDGDIDQDLALLEDRIDDIVQHPSNNTSGGGGSGSSEGEQSMGKSLEDVAKEAFRLTSPLDSMPWLIRYRQALDRSTDSLPQDQINCPALVLLVCTATKEITAPENVLQELYQSNHVLPNVYKRGLYDPSTVQQEVLVLHDNHDHGNFDEPRLRQLLRSQFGPTSSILRINSLPPGTAAALAEEDTTDLWGGGGKLGTFLSDNDRVVLRRYYREMVSSALLPALERRILDLNTIVSERKKGVKNLVKSFWRKPKDETSASEGGSSYRQTASALSGGGGGDEEVKYRYDSIESQTHLLADTLFLMEDYDNAVAIYRLIRDDYKADKSLVHHGVVLEMIALCLYQLDPYTRAREIFGLMQQALLVYTRTAEDERQRKDIAARQLGELNIRHTTHKSYITRLASRLSLVMVLASDVLARGRDLECADLMASLSSYESSLGAAVLMEQSSVFYYKAGLYRKYAFHMLMSGHMFQKAGQHHHAFRCFASALYIYRQEMWDKLYSHLQTSLAAQLFTMKRMAIALVLYAKLIGSSAGGKVSVQSQQKFIQHLVEICEGHTKSALEGANRLAVPPSVPRLQRELYRNDRLEQLVSIIRHTRSASRVLELTSVNLPKISDASVKIWTRSDPDLLVEDQDATTAGKENSSVCRFGIPARGDEAVWEELEIMTIAEANTAEAGKDRGNKTKPLSEETVTVALAKIADPRHRKFIAEIDREKQNRALAERAKRKTQTSKPKIRARGEPIFCDVSMTNPLNIAIEITEMQLVARMTEGSGAENRKTCTTELAIRLNETGTADGAAQSEWTFACAEDLQFTVPEFCRITEPNVKASKSGRSNPFFVVTKQAFELPAEGELSLSLGIAPLIEGDLEILGIRCKLLDKVWLYHAFDIKGPLLKNTRTNIMNKVRGESMYLKSKIECDMPCLTAEVIKRLPPEAPAMEMDDGPLLEGQISTWTLRLRNVGTAPASAITLKTNLPWIDIVKDDHIHSAAVENTLTAEEQESASTSHCLGPSGTLMALPIRGNIDPSQSLDFQIRVRTSCVGEKQQEFYMLYRYDLCDATGHAKPRKSRWLRNMYKVPVYPSLSFRATPLPNYSKGKDMLVSVELTNDRLDRPTDLYITLDRLGLTSRRYRLEALPGQFTKSEQFGDVLQIGWQEQVTVFYRVVAPEAEEGATANATSTSNKNKNNLKNACVLSECPFTESGGTTEKDCTSSSATNHLCLEDAFASFQSAWGAHQLELIRLENTPDAEKEHPRSIHSIRREKTSDLRGSSANESFGGDEDHSCGDAAAAAAAALAFEALQHQPQQQQQQTAIEDHHPTSLSSLCPPSTVPAIHLTCSWRAILGQEVVRGEHYLRKIPIVPVRYVPETTKLCVSKGGGEEKRKSAAAAVAAAACPIAVCAEHATLLEHDFSETASARIPVALTLRNRLLDTPLTVEWSLGGDDFGDDFDNDHHHHDHHHHDHHHHDHDDHPSVLLPLSKLSPASKHYSSLEWIGIRKQTTTLEATGQITVPLEVLVTEPGLFNLQTLSLSVVVVEDCPDHPGTKTKSKLKTKHRPSQEWLIRVSDSRRKRTQQQQQQQQ